MTTTNEGRKKNIAHLGTVEMPPVLTPVEFNVVVLPVTTHRVHHVDPSRALVECGLVDTVLKLGKVLAQFIDGAVSGNLPSKRWDTRQNIIVRRHAVGSENSKT